MSPPRSAATELAADLVGGHVTAAEVMEATLDRIGAVNPTVNAIVSLRDRDDLMAEARAADAVPRDRRGPLHGVPIAVKDLANVKGLPTTQGSPFLADFMPDDDDIMVARMRAAGALFIGKTNTPEFGLGSHTFNPVHGATRNPYDTSKSCGGSSGGAAVALATGMVALADGSDMMGSLRNPAAWSNVYGFRPGFGVVPSEPVADTFLHQLATLGPMARSPADIALLLDVIAGPDRRQPHGCPWMPAAPLAAADLTGKRIGWLGDWGGAFAMEDGVLALCEGACDVLRDLGATVDLLEPPFPADRIWDSWITLRSWNFAPKLKDLTDRGATIKDSAVWEMERGLSFSGLDVHRASVIRSNWFKTAAQLFETYDALVLPSAQVWPFDVDLPWQTEIAGRTMDTYHRWMEVVVPVSLLGLPALAMPAGFGANGLPMGVQIFGPRGSDATILALGQAYHAATEWPQKRPAMP